MDIKQLTTVALAALVVISGYYAWRRPQELGSLEPERTGRVASAEVTPLDIQRIHIERIDSSRRQLTAIEVRAMDHEWVIASHHDYPADGPARDGGVNQVGTALTAAMNLTYGRQVTADARRHGEHGVRDPRRFETGDDPAEFGIRVLLEDRSGRGVVSLIIGSEAEDLAGQTHKFFFARVPEENEVYLVRYEGRSDEEGPMQWADADIQRMFSASFGDWVERDLMKIRADQVRRLEIDQHSVHITEDGQSRLQEGLVTTLRRPASDLPWQAQEAPSDKELDTNAVNDLIRALTGLRIKNVIQRTGRQLAAAGFYSDGRNLYGQDGATRVATQDGMMFELFFGRTTTRFVGDDRADDGPDRYMGVFVRYEKEHDEEIPRRPSQPVAPSAPREPAALADDADDEEREAHRQAMELFEREQAEYAKERAAYEEAVENHPEAMRAWQQRVQEHEEDRMRFLTELNERFARFLYVIDNERFANLRPDAKALFTAEDDEDDETDADADDLMPDIDIGELIGPEED